MRPTLTSSIAPPRAHGASTSTSASSALLGSAQRAPASSLASDRRRSSMSASDELGPGAREPPRELGAHSPHAHDGHGAPAQVGRAEAPLAAGPHGGLHPLGGERARVAAAALGTRQAGHVGRAAGQHRHVAGARAHVLGRHVAAVERVHGVGEVQQHVAPAGACRRRAGLGADHALATAERHARGGRLEGHRARQPKRVPRAVGRALVAPHPAAAEGRPERRGVHGDDRCRRRTAGRGGSRAPRGRGRRAVWCAPSGIARATRGSCRNSSNPRVFSGLPNGPRGPRKRRST